MELRLTGVRDRQIEGVSWQVEFESAFGVGADFLCSAVEVVRVTPCDPGGLVAGRNSE
jgi:hypothetical protein